jgi:hypothetical protein
MTDIAHPIKTIWLQPRSTLRRIVANDPEYGVLLLTVLAGALLAPIEATARLGEQDSPVVLIFTLAAVAGAVKGLFALYVGGWMLSLASRWFGGSASSVDVRAAIAWSNAPLAAGCAVWWILVALGSATEFGEPFTLFAEGVLLAALAWSYAMLAAFLAAVQHFSLRKAVLILAGLWASLGTLMWVTAWIGISGFTSIFRSGLFSMAVTP